MEFVLSSYNVHPILATPNSHFKPSPIFTCHQPRPSSITAMTARPSSPPTHRKPPKNLRYPRRAKLPPDPTLKKQHITLPQPEEEEGEELNWSSEEVDTISSLFQGRIPQKPTLRNKARPLPLPLPYRIRPLGLPTTKKHVRKTHASLRRPTVSDQVYKNPTFLVHLAKQIRDLRDEEHVSKVLDKWDRFLRKGSLSLTIRELGHMGLPDRALQTFCWAQNHPHLFPDDRTLASTVEILARTRTLKKPFDLEKFMASASRTVVEAIARGFIKGGSFNLARKILLVARNNKRTLDPSIHAKLILELGKNPDKYKLVLTLLNELAEMDEFNLSQQDCTAVMKVCIKLGKFEVVESLYTWFKESGRRTSIVMYTTLIHCRYSEMNYREAMALVWEMEKANCVFDLPAYRVVIKLFVALNDLARAVRYYSRLKEAGFTPTYDIYRDLIKVYAASGRLAKCKEVCKEVELAGFKLDKQTASSLLQMGI